MENILMKCIRIFIFTLAIVFTCECAKAYVSIIRPERVWIYKSFGGDCEGNSYLRVFHSLKLGKEIEYNNKPYYEVILFKTVITKVTAVQNLTEEEYPWVIDSISYAEKILGFIREEDETVYGLCHIGGGPIYLTDILSYGEELEDNVEEFTLYNWNLKGGDPWFDNGEEDNEWSHHVIYKSNLIIGTDECRVMNLSWSSIQFIEGIGAAGKGHFAYYVLYDIDSLIPPIGISAPSMASLLWEVYDNGERVYACEQAASVENISFTYSNAESIEKIYDLHGCPISNPLPGTIYIRDGKKFVTR